MLYYNILYYTILYYTILYYAILYYTILCYAILYYTNKCRYSIVVRSWAGVRRSSVQFQPLSTIRVRRQTLQSLWGSTFAPEQAPGNRVKNLKEDSPSQTTKVLYYTILYYTILD